MAEPVLKKKQALDTLGLFLKERPDLFTEEQAAKISELRLLYEKDPGAFESQGVVSDVMRTVGQIPVGFYEGFLTLDGGLQARGSSQKIARKIGQFLGFAGWIPKAMTGPIGTGASLALTAGLRVGSKTAARKVLSRAAGKGLLKGAEVATAEAAATAGGKALLAEARRVAATQGWKELGKDSLLGMAAGAIRDRSIPMLAAKGLMAAPGFGTLRRTGSQLLANSKWMSPGAKGVLAQMGNSGLRIGLAQSVSELGIDPRDWKDTYDEAITALPWGFGFGAIDGAIGNLGTVFPKLLADGKPKLAAKVLQGMAGSVVQGAPSTMRGDSTEEQVYEYLLGGYFGMNSMPWQTEAGYKKAAELSARRDPAMLELVRSGRLDQFETEVGIRQMRQAGHHDAANIALREMLRVYGVTDTSSERIMNVERRRHKAINDLAELVAGKGRKRGAVIQGMDAAAERGGRPFLDPAVAGDRLDYLIQLSRESLQERQRILFDAGELAQHVSKVGDNVIAGILAEQQGPPAPGRQEELVKRDYYRVMVPTEDGKGRVVEITMEDAQALAEQIVRAERKTPGAAALEREVVYQQAATAARAAGHRIAMEDIRKADQQAMTRAGRQEGELWVDALRRTVPPEAAEVILAHERSVAEKRGRFSDIYSEDAPTRAAGMARLIGEAAGTEIPLSAVTQRVAEVKKFPRAKMDAANRVEAEKAAKAAEVQAKRDAEVAAKKAEAEEKAAAKKAEAEAKKEAEKKAKEEEKAKKEAERQAEALRPVPADDNFTLRRTKDSDGLSRYEILDADGKVVNSTRTKHDYQAVVVREVDGKQYFIYKKSRKVAEDDVKKAEKAGGASRLILSAEDRSAQKEGTATGGGGEVPPGSPRVETSPTPTPVPEPAPAKEPTPEPEPAKEATPEPKKETPPKEATPEPEKKEASKPAPEPEPAKETKPEKTIEEVHAEERAAAQKAREERAKKDLPKTKAAAIEELLGPEPEPGTPRHEFWTESKEDLQTRTLADLHEDVIESRLEAMGERAPEPPAPSPAPPKVETKPAPEKKPEPPKAEKKGDLIKQLLGPEPPKENKAAWKIWNDERRELSKLSVEELREALEDTGGAETLPEPPAPAPVPPKPEVKEPTKKEPEPKPEKKKPTKKEQAQTNRTKAQETDPPTVTESKGDPPAPEPPAEVTKTTWQRLQDGEVVEIDGRPNVKLSDPAAIEAALEAGQTVWVGDSHFTLARNSRQYGRPKIAFGVDGEAPPASVELAWRRIALRETEADLASITGSDRYAELVAARDQGILKGHGASTLSSMEKLIETMREETAKLRDEIHKLDGDLAAQAVRDTAPARLGEQHTTLYSQLTTDPERFQNRTREFSKRTANKVAAALEDGTLDLKGAPIIYWTDPKTGAKVILAGHSRRAGIEEGLRRTGKKDYDTPTVEYFGTEAEAIHFALNENANATRESAYERSNVYRRMLDNEKLSKAELERRTKDEGAEAVDIFRLTFLERDGKAARAIEALDEADPASRKVAYDIGTWIGEVRSRYRGITREQENEIYDWLKANYQKANARNMTEFSKLMSKVMAKHDASVQDMVSPKPATDPLNIGSVVHLQGVELAYQERLKELTREQQAADQELKAWIKKFNDLKGKRTPTEEETAAYEAKRKLLLDDLASAAASLESFKRDAGKYAAEAEKQGGLFDDVPPEAAGAGAALRVAPDQLGRGAAHEDVVGFVRDALSEFPGLEATMVRSADQLPFPAPEATQGAVYNGQLFIVTGNISDQTAAARVVIHEAVGHLGIEGVLGRAGLEGVLEDVARAMPKDMDAVATDYRLDLGLAAQRQKAAAEVLARLSEQGQRPGLWWRAATALKMGLRKMGLRVTLSERDFHVLLMRGRRALRRGQAGFAGQGPGLFGAEPLHRLGVLPTKEEAAGFGKEMAKGTLGAYLDAFSRPLNERVRNMGEEGRAAAAKGDEVIDLKKALHGIISDALEGVMRVTGHIDPKAGGAAIRANLGSLMRLQDRIEVDTGEGTSYRNTRFSQALRGEIALTPEEQRIMEPLWNLTVETGKVMEDVGAYQLVETYADGRPKRYELFKASADGKLRVQTPTTALYDVLMWGGDTPAWKSLQAAVAHMNDMRQADGRLDLDRANAHLERIRESLLDTAEANPSGTGRVNMETAKSIELPDIIMVEGREIELQHTGPRQYAVAMAERTTARAAVIKVMGQGITDTARSGLPPQPSIMNELRKGIVHRKGTRIGDQKVLDAWERSLGARPIDKSTTVPGSAMWYAERGLDNGMTVMRSLLLTASAIPNAAETIFGNTPAILGYRNLVATLKDFKNIRDTVDNMGAITRAFGDFSFDPQHPMRSLVRIFREGTARGTAHLYLNELQETLAAGAALNKVRSWQAGEMAPQDMAAAKLIMRGKDQAFIERLVQGRASGEEYAEFVRRAPGVLVGAARHQAEISMLGNKRWHQKTFPFLSYGMMKVESLRRAARIVYDAHQEFKKGGAGGLEAAIKTMRSAEGWFGARVYGATAAQGMAAYLLTALAFGGDDGLEIAVNEASERPVKFLADSFFYSSVTGPLAAVARYAQSPDDSIGNAAFKATFPGMMINETMDFMRGQGRYKDQTLLERSGTFFSQKVPGNAPLQTALAVMGLSDRNPGLEASFRAYWRWRYDNAKPPKMSSAGDISEDQKEFRRNMRRTMEAMRRGQDPAAHLQKVLSLEGGWKKANQSLGARLLLAPLDDAQQAALRQQMGPKAFAQIVAWDATIQGLIDQIRATHAKKRPAKAKATSSPWGVKKTRVTGSPWPKAS